MDTSDNFIKQKGGELFQGKLGRCTTAKAFLKKAMKSLKAVDEFVNAETQPIITMTRKANQVIEGSMKLELSLENLTK